MPVNKNTFLSKGNFAGIAGLVFAYVVLGKLALLLAISPGYATALFPSAGLAVAAVLLWGKRLLPGVFLGSFFLNLWINIESGYPLLSITTLVVLAIAAGALLQAAVGASLIRLYIGFPNGLTGEKEVICFLMLAGPLACLVGASVGAAALLFGGVVAPELFLFSWLTWWVGDVIGVVVMAPLLLIFFAQPRQLWRSRVVTVAVPLIVTCLVVAAVFVRVSQSESADMQSQFRTESAAMLAAVKSQLNGYHRELLALERFYAASVFVDRDEFRSFVAPVLANHAGLQALEWLPRVSHLQRQQFEAEMKATGYPQYQLTELDTAQNIVVAAVREEYFPVAYVEPYLGNEQVLGYDAASNMARMAGLAQARDSGAVAMTAPLELIQFGMVEKGALLLMPVYEKGPLPETVLLRHERTMGFLIGVFNFRDMVNASLTPFPKDTFMLRVVDVTESLEAFPVYGDVNGAFDKYASVFGWSGLIQIGGRTLQLSFSPSEKYIHQNRSWQAWMVLVWGLIFAGMLGALLLIISGRDSKVQQLVDNQTEELRLIFDHMYCGIVVFDEHGLIVSVNPAAERLFGCSRAEMLRMPLTRFMPDIAKYEMAEWVVKESFIAKRGEAAVLCKDGSKLPVEFSVSEIVLADSKFYISTLSDMSRDKQLERTKNEFIATVNRELRPSIAAIRGAVNLFDSGVMGGVPQTKQSIDALITTVTTNNRRLEALMNELTELEQLELGNGGFVFCRHDGCQLIKKAVALASDVVRHQKIELRFQPGMEQVPFWLELDEQRFIQVITSLLLSAVKQLSVFAEVVVAVVIVDAEVEIRISAQSPVTPVDEHSPDFDVLETTGANDNRIHGGAGMGFSVAKIITEKMGGRAGFTIEENGAGFFYTRLPIAP